MAEEEKLSTWVSLIPEVYFDVIARVPAGAALIGGLLGYFAPDVVASAGEVKGFVPGFAALLFFILLSYAAGLLLTPLSGLLAWGSRWRVWDWIWRDYRDLRTQCLKFPALQAEAGQLLNTIMLEQAMCEIVSSSNEVAQSLLLKMRAEAELCNNLSASLAVLAIFFLGVRLFGAGTHQLARVFLLLMLAIYCAGAGAYRTWRLVDRQVTFFRVLILDKRSQNAWSDQSSH